MKNFLMILVALCFQASTASGATYYVATNGSDANSCNSAQNIVTPKRTIRSGIGCLAAGSTLYVRGGTYNEILDSNNFAFPNGNSWSDAPVIASYPGEIVTLAGVGHNIAFPSAQGQNSIQYLILDGFIFDAAGGTTNDVISFWGNTAHIKLQNCEVKNAPRDHNGIGNRQGGYTGGTDVQIINCKIHGGQGNAHGLYIEQSNTLIDRVESYGNAGAGIQLYHEGGYGHPSNCIVRNSIFRNNTIAGMFVYGPNHQVYNNLVYGNPYGISSQNGTGQKIYNNTIYGNEYTGLDISASNNFYRNNTIYDNGRNIDQWGGSGNTYENNLCNSTGSGCTKSGSPLFVNPAGGDFRLQAGSAAIDAGKALTEVASDFSQTPRPQGASYDIGAYEYTTTSSTLPAPSNLAVAP